MRASQSGKIILFVREERRPIIKSRYPDAINPQTHSVVMDNR